MRSTLLLWVVGAGLLAVTAWAAEVGATSEPASCTCLTHSPPHTASLMTGGTAWTAQAAGSHGWEPWFDGSCGYVCRDMYGGPDDAGAAWTTTCESAGVLHGQVTSMVYGGGCGSVAGPTATVLFDSGALTLDPAVSLGADWVEGYGAWAVDHISTPHLSVVFTPAGYFSSVSAVQPF